MKFAHVFLMRHGQYDPTTGALTDQGRTRVAAAARLHLAGRCPVIVSYSSMLRTLDTVQTVLRALGEREQITTTGPIDNRLFGYEWAAAGDQTYYARIKEAIAAGRPNTAAVWYELWPSASYVGKAVRESIGVLARFATILSPQGAEVYALVGSHDFVAVSATGDPNTPCLGEADIIRYHVAISAGPTGIVGWEILRAPTA